MGFADKLVEKTLEQIATLPAEKIRGKEKDWEALARSYDRTNAALAARIRMVVRHRLDGEEVPPLDELPSPSSKIICPHCQTRGHVHTQGVQRKIGISGAKVMGGLLTGGVSLYATGLSQKRSATEAHCANCGSTWDF